MADIGSTSVSIVGNSSQFDAAVTFAMNRFKAFETAVSGFKTGDIAGGTRGLMDLGRTLAQNFNAGSLFSVLGSMPGWFGVAAIAADGLRKGIGAVVGELQDLTREGIANIGAQVAMARQFNTSTAAIAGLRSAAQMMGVGDEALTGGLTRLMRTLGAAQEGSEEARESFAGMGLDWRQLADKTPDQAFGQVADSLRGMTSVAQQAHFANAMFGRGFQELMPLIRRGSELIEAQTQDAREWGAVVDAVSQQAFQRMRESQRVLTDTIGNAREGIVNRFADIAMPIMTFVNETITRGLEAAKPIFAWVREQLDTIADLTRAGIASIEAAWPRIQAALGRVFESWKRFADSLGLSAGIGDSLEDNFENMGNAIADALEAWASFVEMTEPLRTAIAGIFNFVKAVIGEIGKGVFQLAGILANVLTTMSSVLPDALAAPFHAAAERLVAIRNDIAAMSGSGVGGAISTPEERSAERAWQRELAEMYAETARIWEAHENARFREAEAYRVAERAWFAEQAEAASRMTASLMTPLEKFREATENINFWEWIGAMDSDEAARAMTSALDDFDRAMGGARERRFAGVMEAGSVAAASAINTFQFGGGTEDAASRTARLMAEAAIRDADALRVARETRDAVRRLTAPPAAPGMGP